MFLVDMSVWIRFLADRSPSMTDLADLLARDEVSGQELVYGELLIGDKGARCLSGRGIGWVDVHLLASALVGRLRLWTADPRLAIVAGELGVGHP
jgi:predicted nucleic acid-binding protein